MLKEILENIRSAEAVGDEMIRQAGADARRIISDAAHEAFLIRQRAAEESEKEYAHVRKKLGESIKDEIIENGTESRLQIADLNRGSGSKLDMAVEYIVKRIINTDADS
jgi:V/A-type H+/Na+-transporting ATPase subunit G/H